MDARIRELFIGEIARQATFATRSFHELERTLAQGDAEGVWHAVQGFLVAAGNVSKLLWPTREQIPGRGEALRQAFGTSDDSPLAPRTFRNHFEHFDERLEAWAVNQDTSSLVDSNLMPPAKISGLPSAAFLRNLDPSTLVLSFRGDEYDLRRVNEAVIGLQSQIARRPTSGCR